MSEILSFVNFQNASCGCKLKIDDGGGEYSHVVDIILCEKHQATHEPKEESGFVPEMKIRGVGQAYIETEDLVRTDNYKKQIKGVRELRLQRENEKT